MFKDIESLKASIRNGEYGVSGRYGKINKNRINSMILSDSRSLEILFDLEHHLNFNVLEELPVSVWDNRDLFSNIYYYFLKFRNYNIEVLYDFFKTLSLKASDGIKNDGHFLLKKAISLRNPDLIEKFIKIINPKLLEVEDVKERLTKIINRRLAYDLADKNIIESL